MGMSPFGVIAMTKFLKQKGITPPRNVLPYGFSSPNKNADPPTLTLQTDKDHKLQQKVRQLGQDGFPIVWLIHLDDLSRGSGGGLHRTNTPDAVRLFWLPSDQPPPSLNVTTHPAGVRIAIDELTQAELERLASWR